MFVFEIVIALLLAGALLAALARRIATPYPALVALAGAALALMPHVPTLMLDPELALALFVAPVLLDAAFDSSPRDLRRNWRTIASLAIGAVALTVIVVAVVTKFFLPAIPWAAAIALGAIVAPPDAAAATAVLKHLRPPHRLMVILEGESLFNDASALLIYRLAIGAAVTGVLSGWRVVPLLVFVTAGSIILGVVLARVTLFTMARIDDVATAVIFQFCGTFGVWLIAERLHLSGILTVVVFAIATSRRAADVIPARIRVPSYAVWEVAVFVLNVLAFILVGFQLRSIVMRLDRATWVSYAWVALAVCVATILARIAWVSGAAALNRWRCRERADGSVAPQDRIGLSRSEAAVVGWCGMRGTVTLAAALAIPMNTTTGAPFPYRDLIVFTAFAVVLGTLVVQGVTLRPILSRLQLSEDDTVEREVKLARVETMRASLAAIASSNTEAAELVRMRHELLLKREEADGSDGKLDEEEAKVLLAAATAERQMLVRLRAEGVIGDAAFQRVEQELDLEELDLEQFLGAG